MWGTSGDVVFRYGATLAHGQGTAHLLSAGLALGGVAELDAGAAREVVADLTVWRSRFGLMLLAGSYRIYMGRDGGINGFGATYRFGLTLALQ
jgi:hypothetical protein